MPLIKSGSKDAIAKNISVERNAGKKPSQAVAIALDVARRAKRAFGGAVSPADEILRGYASGGDVDFSTEDILAEALRRSEPAPVGLPDYLRGQIQDLKRGEGAYAEDVRPRGAGVWNLMGDVAGLGAEMTGIPSVIRGSGNIRKGWNEGDPVLGAAGLGQVALGALPAVAATKGGQQALGAFLEGPWRSGAAGATLGLPEAVVGMKEANAQSLEADVANKLRAMSPEQLRAYQQIIGVNPDGRIGKDTLSRAVAHEAKLATEREAAKTEARERANRERELSLERARGESAAAMERTRQEGAAAARAAEIRAEAEARASERIAAAELAESEKRRAREEQTKLPIRELLPSLMPFVPVLAGGVAGLSGAAIKNSYANKYNRTLDDLIPRWEAAVKGRQANPELAKSFQTKIDDIRAAGPGGTGLAAGVGATEGLLIGLGPEEIDLYRGVPGAWERMMDYETVGKRAGISALTGAGAGLIGSVKAQSKAQKSENVKDFGPETDALSARAITARTVPQALGADPLQDALSLAKDRRLIDASKGSSGQSGAAEASRQSRSSEGSSNPTSDAPKPKKPKAKSDDDTSRRRSPPVDAKKIEEELKSMRPATEPSAGTWLAAEPPLAALPPPEPTVILKTPRPGGGWFTRNENGRFRGGPVKNSALDTARKYAAGGAVLAGPVIGETGGREDALPVDVEHGSFVVPADIVSHLGTGNTLAGQRKLEEVFGKSKARANGGAVGIMISDGEHVLTPDQVAKVGGGDIERGHAVLDRMILKLRDDHIKTLKSLPGPAKG